MLGKARPRRLLAALAEQDGPGISAGSCTQQHHLAPEDDAGYVAVPIRHGKSQRASGLGLSI